MRSHRRLWRSAVAVSVSTQGFQVLRCARRWQSVSAAPRSIRSTLSGAMGARAERDSVIGVRGVGLGRRGGFGRCGARVDLASGARCQAWCARGRRGHLGPGHYVRVPRAGTSGGDAGKLFGGRGPSPRLRSRRFVGSPGSVAPGLGVARPRLFPLVRGGCAGVPPAERVLVERRGAWHRPGRRGALAVVVGGVRAVVRGVRIMRGPPKGSGNGSGGGRAVPGDGDGCSGVSPGCRGRCSLTGSCVCSGRPSRRRRY